MQIEIVSSTRVAWLLVKSSSIPVEIHENDPSHERSFKGRLKP